MVVAMISLIVALNGTGIARPIARLISGDRLVKKRVLLIERG
jgi:hypothetical protein